MASNNEGQSEVKETLKQVSSSYILVKSDIGWGFEKWNSLDLIPTRKWIAKDERIILIPTNE